MSKKSILAETLAGIQEIREGIERNANHILKSTLKEDLEEIVRKGLNEIDDEEMTDDMGGNEPSDFSGMDNPGEAPEDDFESGEDFEFGSDEDGLGDEEVIDLTDEDDEAVAQTFALMSPADEIEVVKTANGGIQINIEPGAEAGGEVGMEDDGLPMGDEESSMEDDEMSLGDETGEEEEEDETLKEEEVMYEIEFDEEEDMMEGGMDMVDEEEMTYEEKMKELHESLIATRKKMRKLVAENQTKNKELTQLKTLANEFKGSEKEYKSAIKNLKGQLEEVALFTSNLTYAVKLMTENSTTKDEKLDILKRFDKAKSLTESREIFNNLSSLFTETKKSVKKTVNERVMVAPKASGSKNLNESTAYKNPQLDRMLDIINKIK